MHFTQGEEVGRIHDDHGRWYLNCIFCTHRLAGDCGSGVVGSGLSNGIEAQKLPVSEIQKT